MSRQCQRLEMKMTKTLLIFTLAALASALPLDEDRQCEGTLCHAGCCPMQGWYCCEDNMNCTAGEIEFADIPIGVVGVDDASPVIAYLFLLAFVFLIVVVLMNLLNGLAVSDTGMIREKAEVVSAVSRVETISYIESLLLGDPFDFLS